LFGLHDLISGNLELMFQLHGAKLGRMTMLLILPSLASYGSEMAFAWDPDAVLIESGKVTVLSPKSRWGERSYRSHLANGRHIQQALNSPSYGVSLASPDRG
jgi:hypothetical protein